MLRTYQLTLVATQQRLSDVYGGADVPGNEVAKDDIPYRQVILQAATAVAYIGYDPATLSTSIYGNKIAVDGSLVLGPFDTGPIKLSDLYGLGANSVLHVTGIPF